MLLSSMNSACCTEHCVATLCVGASRQPSKWEFAVVLPWLDAHGSYHAPVLGLTCSGAWLARGPLLRRTTETMTR
eukprot:365516-Chlamydomonas_euryale.AAC.2